MNKLYAFLGAATVCTLASLASTPLAQAQQVPKFNIGDMVDVNMSGQWQSCNVTAPLVEGSYSVRCGSSDLHAKLDSVRPHVAAVSMMREATEVKEVVARIPQGESVGARYGTREPRTCDRRKSDLNGSEAKDIFICDAEHEFGGTLYLVSDVSLVSSPRTYQPNLDAAKPGIDPSQPVVDISASYNNYKCSQVSSAMMDFPGNRNCDETKMSNNAGGCYKTTAGEWHCQVNDYHTMATATASNVQPPTIVE